jgi:Reverse transcriptase (RNA-dependent DNA polymerase)
MSFSCRTIFFGGRPPALNTKDGGIRPIALGMTLRRLVSKCAATIGWNQLADWLSPHQLRIGAPGGCETAVHAARRYLEAMPPGHVVAKLDFRNAFNSIHRRDLLMAVSAQLPQVYSYCFSAYAKPSFLFYGPFRVLSQEGIQQGDPLGFLLFFNSIHPLLQTLDSLLKLGYLDYLTVAGPEETVATDVSRIIQIGGSMGLQPNVSKCELICAIDSIITDPTLSSFKIVQPIDSTLLGAPLFPSTAINRA